MAQHDFSISNQGFPATRADINNFLQAVASTHSGTTTPSGAVAGTIWLDTTSATAPILKYYDGVDNITLATIDHVANTVNFSDSALDLITDTTPELGGNLNVNTHSIVSTSNGNITLTPNGTGQIIVNAGAVGTPTIAPTGDTNTGIFFPSADTIAFTEGGTEAMRIDSSGRVGIGTTSAGVKLDVSESGALNSFIRAITTSSGQRSGCIVTADNVGTAITGQFIAYGDGQEVGINVSTNHPLTFGTNNTERMRINSSGIILIGKTASNFANAGAELSSTGSSFQFTRSGATLDINRTGTDGALVRLHQDGTLEGDISISGTTTSYNSFTGSHWSRFIDESKPDVLRGTVMESLDQMTDWYHAEFEVSTTEKDKDGNDVVKTTTEKKPYALKANEQEGDVITYNWNTNKKDEEGNDIIEQVQATIVKQVDVKHVMSKISDTSEAKNVYGVFSAWDNDDLINNDFYVASCGSYVVRIKAGQTVSKGDLLQSNGDGTAKVQADDIIRASTFAKVLSNTVIDTYEDGSFIVPCSLMC